MATDDKTPGLGSIENPVKFKDQDFKKILEVCLKSGKLFSDPAFPAEQRSVGMPEDPDPKKAIKWLRPKVGSPARILHLQRSRIVCRLTGSYGKGEFSHFRFNWNNLRDVGENWLWFTKAWLTWTYLEHR